MFREMLKKQPKSGRFKQKVAVPKALENQRRVGGNLDRTRKSGYVRIAYNPVGMPKLCDDGRDASGEDAANS
jgi:hypothetical protein